MSDLLALGEAKVAVVGTGNASSAEFGAEGIYSEVSSKSSTCEQFAISDSVLPIHHGESFLQTAAMIVLDKPKAGLTKTKKNLKKQLFLKKAAAQDDGRQTPILPSPNRCSEDGYMGTSYSQSTPTCTTSGSVIDSTVVPAVGSEKAETKDSGGNEGQTASITVKVEAVDDDLVSSSASVGSVITPMHRDNCTIAKTAAASEDVCPSSNETISQSGAEIAGPTKWIIGDMLWARVSGHPWWPCMVAYDPSHTAFTRTLKRRQGTLVQYHVQFFGDEGERGWISEGSIIPYEGAEAFNRFCDEMKVLHKKDRQNYTVPPRRVKAWNVAVRSAEEAYPMTRVFRVHRFAFVYDQPIMANGSVVVAENRLDGGPQVMRGVKRSRSSSLGIGGNVRPKKQRRISGEKNVASPTNTASKMCWLSPNNRMPGQVNQENSLCEGASPELGATVFMSRAEGVKRSSRFVKPTNRIMEHLEEVQQRRRIKLRPHRKISGSDSVTDHSAEDLPGISKENESLLTPAAAEEVLNETTTKQANEAFPGECRTEMMEVGSPEVPEHSQLNSPCSDSYLQMKDMSSHLITAYPQDLKEAAASTVVPVADSVNSASTESHDVMNQDIKVEVNEVVLNSQSRSLSVTEKSESEKSSLSSTQSLNKLEDEVGLSYQQNASPSASDDPKDFVREMPLNCCDALSSEPDVNHSEEHLEHDPAASIESIKERGVAGCEPSAVPLVNVADSQDIQPDITNTEPKSQKRRYRKTKNLSPNGPQDVMRKKVQTSKCKNLVIVSDSDAVATVASSLKMPSVTSSTSTPTKQRRLPGRRKSSVVSASVMSDSAADPPPTASAMDSGILQCCSVKCLPDTGSRFPPEFQRLSSVGPQKSEEVCHICEQSGDILIDCQGPCFGSYHLSCLGLTVSPVGAFRCDECSTGNHPCFVCKHTSRDTVACSAPKCGRFYHRECANKFLLCKMDSTSITCPLHTCATCAAETGKNCRANKGPMYRCIRCPTAYHASDYCIAAGTVEIAGHNIICNNHLLSPKSPKHGLSHINATWCFVCSKEGGHLTLCSSCPAAFHASCAKINLTSEAWQCKDCLIGKRPLYGEVVWAKVGNYRWWPGEVCHLRNSLVESANKAGHFAVRLFGVGFQFWLQQGRVFPFRENDRLSHEPVYRTISERFERAVSEAAEVYLLRLTAKDGKTNSDREKNDQKPAYYKHVKVNIPLGNVEILKLAPSEILSCHCSPTMENPCGPDSDCINRLMMYECNALVCPAGENCLNQRFQKREDSDVRPYKTEQRGWGLRNRSSIKKGQFIAEYVGDLVDPDECNRRLEYAQQHNITNFYMLTLDKNRVIDAGPRGNYSRFMNHSCEPNCETQKWTVNGDIRVGLFALSDLAAGSELTFNYNLDCYGNQKTVCKCGSSICSGFLGVRPKTTAAANVEKKVREAKLKKQLKEIKSKDRPDICYACKKRGGEIIVCENEDCVKNYHRRCVKFLCQNNGKFICPLHKCDACHLDASKPCSICPRSFCLLHFDGNIFEISDGSLVCSKHQDILSSCLQDRWISSSQDGNSGGSNGISAQTLTEKPLVTSDNSVQDHKNSAHKQSEISSKTSTTTTKKVVRRRKTETGAPAASEAGPKKRGRPLKTAVNGSVEKKVITATAEQSAVDSNNLITKKPRSTVNRRSKEKLQPSDERTLESSLSRKRKCKAGNNGGDVPQLKTEEKAVLRASVAGCLKSDETVVNNSVAVSNSETDTVEILSEMNSRSHNFDRSTELISDGSTQEQFSPLVLEQSF